MKKCSAWCALLAHGWFGKSCTVDVVASDSVKNPRGQGRARTNVLSEKLMNSGGFSMPGLPVGYKERRLNRKALI